MYRDIGRGGSNRARGRARVISREVEVEVNKLRLKWRHVTDRRALATCVPPLVLCGGEFAAFANGLGHELGEVDFLLGLEGASPG